MADLHHLGDWVRVRHLHADHVAVHRRPGGRGSREFETGIAGVRAMARAPVLRSGSLWRYLWPFGGLAHRQAGPTSHSDLEHLALRMRDVRFRLRDLAVDAARPEEPDVYRRLRRVRGGHCLDRRTV